MSLLERIFAFLARLLSAKREAPPTPAQPVAGPRTLAWGKHPKVTPAFRAKVFEIADDIRMEADDLMACMAFETGGTFDPAERNKAGSGATGLIQFMPEAALGLGTTTQALAAMTAVEQLEFVRAYFKPYTGRLKTLSDVYMAILWPAGIGKPENWALWDKSSRPTTYRQNAGLDIDKDGFIRKSEAAARVQAWLDRGQLPENLWRGE